MHLSNPFPTKQRSLALHFLLWVLNIHTHQCLPERPTQMERTSHTKYWWKCGALSYSVGGKGKHAVTWESNWTVSQNVQYTPTLWFSHSMNMCVCSPKITYWNVQSRTLWNRPELGAHPEFLQQVNRTSGVSVRGAICEINRHVLRTTRKNHTRGVEQDRERDALSDSFDMEVGSRHASSSWEARMVVSLSVRWGGAQGRYLGNWENAGLSSGCW